jgi:hypothetical protein
MERAIWLAAPGLCLLLLVRPRGEFAAKQTR